MSYTSATAAQNAANQRLALNRTSPTDTYTSAVPKYGFWIGFQTWQNYKTSALPGLTNNLAGTSFSGLMGNVGAGAAGVGSNIAPGVAGGQNARIGGPASQGGTQSTAAVTNAGAVYLPLPMGQTMIDQQDVQYTEYPFGPGMGALKAAGALIGGVGGRPSPERGGNNAGAIGGISSDIATAAGWYFGIAANEFRTVLLQGPKFKQYNLSFNLLPHSPQDSINYVNIIKRLRYAAAPEPHFAGAIWEFPQLVQCLYVPQGDGPNTYMYRFKPAVLQSVQASYAPSGIPAFYKGTSAPESIILSLQFLEIEYWIRSNFEGSPGTLVPTNIDITVRPPPVTNLGITLVNPLAQ